MTIPAWGRLVLRRASGKRPPQHSKQRKSVKFGVHRQAFSSESQFGFEMRQEFDMMSGVEVGKWEMSAE